LNPFLISLIFEGEEAIVGAIQWWHVYHFKRAWLVFVDVCLPKESSCRSLYHAENLHLFYSETPAKFMSTTDCCKNYLFNTISTSVRSMRYV